METQQTGFNKVVSQDLYFTSGESSELEDEQQENSPPTVAEEKAISSSAMRHVLLGLMNTSVSLALMEGLVEDYMNVYC